MIKLIKVLFFVWFISFALYSIKNDNNKVLKVESNLNESNNRVSKTYTKKRCKGMFSNKVVDVSCRTIGINGYD